MLYWAMRRKAMNLPSEKAHVPVLLEEAVALFSGMQLTTFFEGTVGAGNHAKAILEAHPEIKRYIACDADPMALQIAERTLSPWKEKVEFVQGNFSHLDSYLSKKGIESVDGFFLILESPQCSLAREREDSVFLKRGL